MIKIFNTKQVRAADAFTIAHEPITSIDLMERASQAFVQWFVQHFDTTLKVGVVCGTGNNGGDGLAIARLLSGWGYQVNVWIIAGSAPESEDFKKNKERLPTSISLSVVAENPRKGIFSESQILIDAIFGSGLSRPPEGIYASVIKEMNTAEGKRVAVDIPSGMRADEPSTGEAVLADYTVSFQFPKLAFLLPENAARIGQWHVVDIGLHRSFIQDEKCEHGWVTKKDVKKILPVRNKFAHKGTYGRALLIAGSYGKMGACVLSARAAMRSGAGLLTVHIPKRGYDVIQTAVPEAMATVDVSDTHFTGIGEDLQSYDVIGIGPGIGQTNDTREALRKVLESGKPLVLDADALNILSNHPALLHLVPAGSVLTPHAKEFERLVGSWQNSFERLDKQRRLANDLQSVVVVKGAYTAIAEPGGTIYFNSSGNPGMATAGAGDVLTGIITGLKAQQLTSCEAAVAGVYLHGLSGDLAVCEGAEPSLIATDLIDYLPQAFRSL